jgi:hypothetical protein
MAEKKGLIEKLKDKKLTNTLILILSAAFLIAGISLALFSCKAQPSAYESYSMPTDWKSVLQDSKWLVDSSSSLDSDSYPEILRMLAKLEFLSSNGNVWTCRLEASTAQTDECTVTMDGDKGTLVYGPVSLGVHLSESDSSYFMRLTGSDNKTVDLALKK